MSARPKPDARPTTARIDRQLAELAFEAADSGAWVWRPAAQSFQVEASWAAVRHIEVGGGSLDLQQWLKRVHPDDRATLNKQLAAASSSDRLECEYRLARGEDAWIWVLHRGRVLERDAAGAPLLAVGLLVDIDTRKRAETMLAEDQTRLATALWGARAAFWQWHVPTDTGTSSAMWFAMTGYSREQWESVAQPWSSRLHPDDREWVLQHQADHVAGRSDKIEHEYRIKVANGSWKWILDRGRAIEWDLEGKPTLVMGVSLDIDSAKRAEEQLRSVESRLQTAVWGAGVGLWELDFRTGLTRWYNDWCTRHDVDPCDGEDHVARWDDNLHPDEGPEAVRRFSAHVAGERDHYDAEYRIRTRSGDWRWVFERGRVVERDEQGAALRMVGICMDIAERKAADLQLRADNERQEAALRLAGGGLWQLRFSTDEANHSDAFYELFGVEPAAGRANRRFWQDHVHPEEWERAVAEFRRAAAVGKNEHESEYRFRHADGSWHWAFDRVRILERNANGEPELLVGMIVDITARKSRELALVASDQRFRAAAAAVSGIVYEIDLETGIVDRHGVERTLGYADDALSPDFGGVVAAVPSGRPRPHAAGMGSVPGDWRQDGICRLPRAASRWPLYHRVRFTDAAARRQRQGDPRRGLCDRRDQADAREDGARDERSDVPHGCGVDAGFCVRERFHAAGKSQLTRVSEGFETAMGCGLEEFQQRGDWSGCLTEDCCAAGLAMHRRLYAGSDWSGRRAADSPSGRRLALAGDSSTQCL